MGKRIRETRPTTTRTRTQEDLVMFRWLKLRNKKPVETKDPITEAIESAAKRVWEESNNRTLTISEPVTSFLKCFKQQPRRFRFVRTDKQSGFFGSQYYKFTDTKTSESWRIAYRPMHNTTPHIEDVTWMTTDERALTFEVIAGHYSERAERLSKIRKDKHTAKVNKERDRLTQIYKV